MFLRLFLSVTLLTGCHSDKVHVMGRFENCPFDYMILHELLPTGQNPIDTVAIIRGNFAFPIKRPEIKVYLLQLNDTLLLPFIAQGGDRLQLTGDALDFDHTYLAFGNDETPLLLEARSALTAFEDSVKTLSRLFKEHQREENFTFLADSLNTVYEVYFARHQSYLRDFIARHPDKLSALISFSQTLGRRAFLNPKTDLDLMKLMYERLSHRYPTSEYVIELSHRIEYVEQEGAL